MEVNKDHPQVDVPIHSESGIFPAYASSGASGCDLTAGISDPVSLQPLERTLIPTGIRVEIPRGFEAQIRPRSGLAYRKGLSLPNTPGTIDADYRGEIKVLVINLSADEIQINPGERIAQMVFAPVVQANFQPVADESRLNATVRQEGGFGSTGE